MNSTNRLYFSLCIVLFLSVFTPSNNGISGFLQDLWNRLWNNSPQTLAADEEGLTNRLDNGIRCYVRTNAKGSKTVSLRLALNVGSLHEEDNERGFAHLLEHLCLQELQNLPSWMSQNSLQWGEHINAETHFDCTLFRIDLPTSETMLLAEALQLLSHILQNINLSPDAFEREKFIVLQELSQQETSKYRAEQRWLEGLLRGSRYAERFPFGLHSNIETALPESLKKFHQRWYQPSLASVIVVGDVELDSTMALIRQTFSPIKPMNRLPSQPSRFVPTQSEPQVLIHMDPDIDWAEIRVGFKQAQQLNHPLPPKDLINGITSEELYAQLVNYLFHDMLNFRLKELIEEDEASFFQAQSSYYRPIAPLEVFQLRASTSTELVANDLELMISEIRRIHIHGFTQEELTRAKARQYKHLQQQLDATTETSNQAWVDDYISSCIYGRPFTKTKTLLINALDALSHIQLSQTNAWIHHLLRSPENCVIWICAPAHQRTLLPNRRSLRKAYMLGMLVDVEPYYEANSSFEYLIPKPTKDGEIEEEVVEVDPKASHFRWSLDNGIRVHYTYQETFDKNLLLRALAPGGTCLAQRHTWSTIRLSTDLAAEWKMTGLSPCECEKLFPGHSTDLHVRLYPCSRELKGSCVAGEEELLFRRLHLLFTSQRCEELGPSRALRKAWAQVNRPSANPSFNFESNSLMLNSENHSLFQQANADDLQLLDCEYAKSFYKRCFQTPSDFHLTFAGGVDPEIIKQLTQRYLASIPSSNTTQDSPLALPYCRFPKGISTLSLNEQKGPCHLRLCFPINDSIQATSIYPIKIAAKLLEKRLNRCLRQDLGLTYGVSVSWENPTFPSLALSHHRIDLHCALDTVDTVLANIIDEIRDLQEVEVSEDELITYQELLKQLYEHNLNDSSYWVHTITNSALLDWNYKELISHCRPVPSISKQELKTLFQQHFPTNRYSILQNMSQTNSIPIITQESVQQHLAKPQGITYSKLPK